MKMAFLIVVADIVALSLNIAAVAIYGTVWPNGVLAVVLLPLTVFWARKLWWEIRS